MALDATARPAVAVGNTQTLENVQEYYGKVLSTSKDLKTSACTTANAPPSSIKKAMRKVPQEVKDKYYGCGSPLPTGISGLSVLDLGSGSGRDCYLASQLVGEKGSVVGIDMTDEQLDVARKYADEYCQSILGYPSTNLRFEKGYIEYIQDAGVENESIDLVISNCVVNLSPEKEKVIQGVYNALRYGGELYFSDVYCDRRLSEEIRADKVLWGECISGALYVEDFKRICNKVGFTDVRQVDKAPISITDPELKRIVGEAKFFSITYRCFKLKDLETLCEDYGQVAYYNGTIPDSEHSYKLDDHHIFETKRPMLVCGNTASMLEDSWLSKHFKVVGDRSVHFGLFDCSGPETCQPEQEPGLGAGVMGGASCC